MKNNNIKDNICVIATGKGMGNFFSNIAYFKQIYREEGCRITFLTRKLTSAADVFKDQSFCEKVHYIDEYKRGLKGLFENLLSFFNIIKLINKINPKKIFILHSSSRYTMASILSNVSLKNIYAPGYKLQNFLIKNENKIFKSYFSKPLEPKLENKLLVEKIYDKKITEDNSIKLNDNQKKEYVCINTNLINRRSFKHPQIKNAMNRTGGWHTDTRTIGGKIVFRGLSYICTMALEDFTIDNGGTCYIPGSHLKKSIPRRHVNYKHKSMVIKAGTVVLFDSALWHRGGKSSKKSRWSIVNYYGPWWMKPYYDFEKQLGIKKISKLNKDIRKMFHYYSTPPKNDHLRISTVIKS